VIDAEDSAQVGIVICNETMDKYYGATGAMATSCGSFRKAESNENEKPEQTMIAELHEEVGLKPEDVKILGGN